VGQPLSPAGSGAGWQAKSPSESAPYRSIAAAKEPTRGRPQAKGPPHKIAAGREGLKYLSYKLTLDTTAAADFGNSTNIPSWGPISGRPKEFTIGLKKAPEKLYGGIDASLLAG
jgi:hypothetical protein